jgi:antitoxin ParD1/3/4
MPTQNVNLSEKQVAFIRKAVKEGGFRNASEVVRAGLRLLEQEQRERKLKLAGLRRLVKDGFAAIDAGEFETVTSQTVDTFLDSVRATPRRRKSA